MSDVDRMLDWAGVGRRQVRVCWFALALLAVCEALSWTFTIGAPQVIIKDLAMDPRSFMCLSLKYLLAIPVQLLIGFAADKRGRLAVLVALLVAAAGFTIPTLDTGSRGAFMTGFAVVEAVIVPCVIALTAVFVFESFPGIHRGPVILSMFLAKSVLGLVIGPVVNAASSGRDWASSVVAVVLVTLIPIGLAFMVKSDTPASLVSRGYRKTAYTGLTALGAGQPPIAFADFGCSADVNEAPHQKLSLTVIHALGKGMAILQDSFLPTFVGALTVASDSPGAAISICALASAAGLATTLALWKQPRVARWLPLTALVIGTVATISLLPAGMANNYFPSHTSRVDYVALIAIGCVLASLVVQASRSLILIATLTQFTASHRGIGVAHAVAAMSLWRFKISALHEAFRTASLYYELQGLALLVITTGVFGLMWRNKGLMTDSFGSVTKEPKKRVQFITSLM